MTAPTGTPEAYYRRLWASPSLGHPTPNAAEQTRLEVIRRLLAAAGCPRPGFHGRILDAGCGRGWLAAQLAGYGSVIAIDPLHASTDRAHQLFPTMRLATGYTSMFRSGVFDVVVSSEVIEHVCDQAGYLQEMARVLAPGGYLVLTTPRGEVYDKYWTVFPTAEQQPVERWLREGDLTSMAKSAGLRVCSRETIFEPFTRSGAWRLYSSVKVNAGCEAIPWVRTLWHLLRSAHALYFCGLFQKTSGA